jgi:hypothetical protein
MRQLITAGACDELWVATPWELTGGWLGFVWEGP